jgi:metallo-beta-lactamase family protein
MKIKFIGATNDVTGSMTLLKTDEGQYLIDCGLYQGLEETVRQNLIPLPFKPSEIKAIFLTHAHLDHSGNIPRLVKLGFRGAIYCTKATVKLARFIMSDSAELMEKNENSFMKNYYETEHVGIAYGLFQVKNFETPFSLDELNVTFLPAGHILGAASVKIVNKEKTYIFSGDLGRSNDPIMPPPKSCPEADLVVLESTYGDRLRSTSIELDLAIFLKKVKNENKVGIIASFAVARAQMLITLIQEYYIKHPNDKVRLIMDGPMMTDANKIYMEHANEFICPKELKYSLGNIENIQHLDEWKSIQKHTGPLIVISSSGMITGGRIWRYLTNWQEDENAIIFLPGFQAEGTPGRNLKEGKREIKDEEGNKIHWSGSVMTSDAFSSHADQDELIAWTNNLSKKTKIFLNHGDKKSKSVLCEKLIDHGFIETEIASSADTFISL